MTEVIRLTETAQERAKTLLGREETPKEGLRVAVIGGGCSGLQYKIGWDNSTENDLVHEYENGLKVMVDPKSGVMLSGAIIEFHDSLERSGFEVENPNAQGCCGCGKSFSKPE